MDTELVTLASVTELLEITLAPILVIELVILWRRGMFRWNQRTKEMLTNVFSIVFLYAGALSTYLLWERLFASINVVLPYRIPVNWLTIVLAILIADFIYYWEHRLEHEKRGLWAMWHSVHHSSPVYDITTSLRLGFSTAC